MLLRNNIARLLERNISSWFCDRETPQLQGRIDSKNENFLSVYVIDVA